VEEVLKEIKQGDYDLVCMGSPYSSHSLLHLYTPNVTAEVAETAHIPILTARFEAPQES
jgi:nucleotide-binding universal stress UspA family protein